MVLLVLSTDFANLHDVLYAVLILIAIHILILLAICCGIMAAYSTARPNKISREQMISVIVPFRNEESNLGDLMINLLSQEYSNFEIILVDDHSTDGSVDVIRPYLDESWIKVLSSSGHGKKHALTHGIAVSAGEIIVTTDADCSFSDHWLSTINSSFESDRIKMVFGSVRITPGNKTFEGMQCLEFASVVGVGIAAHAFGIPLYCNGANLAFRKQAFQDVNGYDGNLEIPSGDDEFLLKKISAKYPGGIGFVSSRHAIVTTKPQNSVAEFFHQRIRWAGKWNMTAGIASRVFAVSVYLMQCAIIAGYILLLLNPNINALAFALGGKVTLELVLLFLMASHLQFPVRLKNFVLLQIVYPFYVIYVGIAANFSTYVWKGRRHHSRAMPEWKS
jgi:poly-beta-1,6-N-acetyl-D-glucosamine synthase